MAAAVVGHLTARKETQMAAVALFASFGPARHVNSRLLTSEHK